MTKLILTSIVFICGIFLSHSQQYSFINYGVKDGLAQSQVTDICQDNLGYLWIGTQSGISRFDGKTFVNYSKDDGIADNTIHKLYFDSITNILWISTPKGLSKYENGQFKSFLYEETQKTNDIIIHNNEIIIGTNSGIIIFKDDSFTYLKNDIKIRQFAVDANKNILCASKTGLFVFKDNELMPFEDEKIANKNYSGISIKSNKYILSTYGEGVFEYDNYNQNINLYDIKYKNTRGCYAFNDQLWVFGNFGCIEIDKQKQITYYSEKNGLPINSIKKVFVDNENNVWIGTYGKGLLKFSSKSVISYSTKDELASDIVMSINQVNESLIFGTYDKGISIMNHSEINSYDITNGLNHNSVWAINSINNKIVIGTTAGLNIFDGKNITTNENIKGKIRSILKINDTTLFIGGKNGLWQMSPKSSVCILDQDNYDINKIHFANNTIYLGTKTGVYWQNIRDLKKPFKKINLPEENCNTIATDVHNNLWVGTVNGLFIVSQHEKIMTLQLDSNNFKSKNIMGIIKDSNGLMWVSTTNGVYLLESKNPFDAKPIQYHYSNSEGLRDLECNLNALFEDKEGYIWVGTSTSLVKINPTLNGKLFKYKLPQLNISSIKLFKEDFNYQQYAKTVNQLTNVPNDLKLPHTKNHLTFNFIGINFKNSKKVQYSYRLMGAEDDWSPLSSETSATYSFISPGDYVFQVKATNDNYNWSEVESINITITSPFYKTWWFITLSIIGIILLVYLIFKLRINAVKRIKDNEQLLNKNRLRELEQQSLNASMNRHFIFNSLNSIQYFINSSDKLSANKFLSNFAKLIRKNLDSSTSDNFIVNLEEEIERITLYLKLEKMRFGEKFDYDINIDETIDLESVQVPSMILQPFIENSIIHGVLPKTTQGQINLNIKKEHDSVVFEVIDNGVGIDESLGIKSEFAGDHESKGMMITANRIDLIRKINGGKLLIIGPFQINDKNNKSLGTKVIIKIPINE